MLTADYTNTMPHQRWQPQKAIGPHSAAAAVAACVQCSVCPPTCSMARCRSATPSAAAGAGCVLFLQPAGRPSRPRGAGGAADCAAGAAAPHPGLSRGVRRLQLCCGLGPQSGAEARDLWHRRGGSLSWGLYFCCSSRRTVLWWENCFAAVCSFPASTPCMTLQAVDVSTLLSADPAQAGAQRVDARRAPGMHHLRPARRHRLLQGHPRGAAGEPAGPGPQPGCWA